MKGFELYEDKETFKVEIPNIQIDTNSTAIEVDVIIQIEELELEVFGIWVTKEGDFFCVHLPTICFPDVFKPTKALRFVKASHWKHIQLEIVKYVRNTKWILEFFKDTQISKDG